MPTFRHSGDLGDSVYALPSVRALGGGDIYFVTRPWTRTRWNPALLSVIKPLIDASGYAIAHLDNGEEIDYDFSSFRHGGYKLGDTILERQRRWVGAGQWDGKPWLQAEPNCAAPIVINRAARWHGFDFPWRQVLEAFYDDIAFIGLQGEHEAFQKEFGKVFFLPCADLLEAAQIIAGADLFIGNQSAANAIASGLGKKIVLEVCPYGPDCFLKGAGTFYSFNGEAEVEALGRKFQVPARSSGRCMTCVGGRALFADDPDKLRVLARGLHAFQGTHAFYDDVEVSYA